MSKDAKQRINAKSGKGKNANSHTEAETSEKWAILNAKKAWNDLFQAPKVNQPEIL